MQAHQGGQQEAVLWQLAVLWAADVDSQAMHPFWATSYMLGTGLLLSAQTPLTRHLCLFLSLSCLNSREHTSHTCHTSTITRGGLVVHLSATSCGSCWWWYSCGRVILCAHTHTHKQGYYYIDGLPLNAYMDLVRWVESCRYGVYI